MSGDADLRGMRAYHLWSAERVMAEVASEDLTPLELEAPLAILRPAHGRVLSGRRPPTGGPLPPSA